MAAFLSLSMCASVCNKQSVHIHEAFFLGHIIYDLYPCVFSYPKKQESHM